jgi:nucleoside-diphosphate-sugar epimerase
VTGARGTTPLALVTGANGFVGSHLVEALVAAGLRVRCLVRATSDTRWLPRSGVERVAASLDDAGALRDAAAGASLVFHLAAVTSSARREDYERTNVDGTRRLLDAVRAAGAAARVVFCSSTAAAGPARGGRAVAEDDPPRPVSAYGASKLAAERVVSESGLDAVIVRPPPVYGPRDRDILAAFRLAARGLALRVGPADQRLSMIHVEDLARALVLAAECGTAGARYHVNDGAVHTWASVSAAIGEAVGRRVRAVPVPRPAALAAAAADALAARLTGRKPLLTGDRIAELAQADWTCDASRARRELGFAPQVALPDGMRATAAWYREQGWL